MATKKEIKEVENTKEETINNEVEEPKKTPKKVSRSTSIDHKCPNCNAKLEFKADLNRWKCDYCDSQFELSDLEAHINNAATAKKNDDSEVMEDDDTVYVTYNCSDCGAEIIADEQTSATFCIYCGNTAILKNKLAGKFKPDYVIPFKKTVEDAKAAFAKVTDGKIFTPNTFKSKANIEKIRGVYIPFWLYTVLFQGGIQAEGTKSTHWSSGDTRYTKTDYYNVIREGNMTFKRVPVDGSTRFDNDLMNTIEPFNYTELVPYNHAYLSGFVAEKYDIDKTTSYKDARDRIVNSGEQQLLNSCTGYESKVVKLRDYRPMTTECEYVLLPVYMVNVKYEDKYYTFAMNGQTGEFVGNVPIDKNKVRLYFIKKAVIIFLVCLLINFIFFLLGGIN